MFEEASLTFLICIFLASTCAVWYVGIKTSQTVDILDRRLRLGQALGGMIFLAIVTNLPEIAIVISASFANNVAMAVSNILGGIAIQTAVLALLDSVALKNKAALTYVGASLQIALEAILLICILVTVIIGAQLPKTLIFFRIAPADLCIVFCWIISLWLINKARRPLPWHINQSISNIRPQNKRKKDSQKSTFLIFVIFFLLAFVILAGGVMLEESSRIIAKRIGMSGAIFGATILAGVTALPEISTGYAAIKMGKYNLAFSDIFGGNAFLPVLFILVTFITNKSVLPEVTKGDIYLTCLSILLTATYIVGLIFRPKRQIFTLGIDSTIVLTLYAIGIAGLFKL